MTTHEFNNLQKGLQKYAKDITDSVLGGGPVPVTAPKPMAIGGFSGSTSPPVVQQNNNSTTILPRTRHTPSSDRIEIHCISRLPVWPNDSTESNPKE